MNKELQQKLYDEFPKIFRRKDLPMSQTCMCWGIECGDGWYELIRRLCSLIQGKVNSRQAQREWAIKNGKEVPDEYPQIEAEQVKEKFGGLRFYTSTADEYIWGAIEMAKSMSYSICDVCGKPGKPNKHGWIKTRCEEHSEE